MTVANAKPDLLITGPLGTTTVNGASSAWSAFTGVEAKLTAAIAYAVSIGAKAVYVPDCFLPYTASQVTFNNAVKMLREGSDPAVHDPQAYGAAGNAVITARATGAGTKATITGQDDTVALQACINAAAANLEVVILPPNAFRITAPLTIPSNSQVWGSGWNSQICPDWFDASGAQSAGAGYIKNADQVNGNSNIVLRQFYLNGAGPGTATANGLPNGAAAGIFFRSGTGGGCLDIMFREIKITNTPGISIAYQGCQRIQIVNNLIHDTGKDGITGCWFTGPSRMTDVIVQGNTIWNVGDDGIACLSSQDATSPNSDQRPLRIAIVGNTIRDVTSNGSGRGIITLGCDDVVIAANNIQNSYGVGIAIWYDSYGGSNFNNRRVAITGNTIQDAGQAQGAAGLQPQHAISINGAQNVTVTGNVIDHAYASGIIVTDTGLAIGTCTDIAITGNQVSTCGTDKTADFGIYLKGGIANGVRRCMVTGNLVTANLSGGIAVLSAQDVLVADNQVTNNGQAGTHTNAEAGIWASGAGGLATTLTVRGNYVTDTQGTKTQPFGFLFNNLGTAVTFATIQDNFFKGNFNSGTNGEIFVSTAPTSLIYRRDDTTPFVLTDAATVAVNAFVGAAVVLTCNIAGATRAIGAPTNPSLGQRIHFTIIQDGTGGRAVTWNAVYKVTWADTGNTLNKRSTIAVIYDGTSWNQDGAQSPYV